MRSGLTAWDTCRCSGRVTTQIGGGPCLNTIEDERRRANYPLKTYHTILADPPWSTNQQGARGASMHYPLMKLREICDLPVQVLAADDAHLWLWVTNSTFLEGLRVIEAWGSRTAAA
ncbi:MT-A70 family methyltransferase [Amycolatopsis sp., V23-08]|uniref:MT-A70 family methyltransferase n=1 Tax=Amycolatopsis heterodermiae TaxID=3110235 RepID=A0ABU5R068_9PSEU|nr:MT-A70 family methyltransferase [Amycolatopsis sp., V23-08]MEA5358761.1 MT-A70 family methyltransferase [Amycolatopsis sp., V23-08]